jgi:hypothetical protein
MTTSGVSNFNYTTSQIIRRALRLCGAIQAGETPGAQVYTDTLDALNAMVKELDATGIHVWCETEGILYLQPKQIQYGLGGSATDNATQSSIQTTLSAAVASGATTLPLTSTAGILSGDNIGVTLPIGGIFWTTVNGAPTSTTVTIGSGITANVSAGAFVFDYTSRLLRPLRVLSARRYNIQSQIETATLQIARIDYREMPNKSNTGTVTQYFYDPQLGTGQFWVWPAPLDSSSAVKFTWMRQIQDFVSPANTPDLPQEWINALCYNLAVEMANEFDVPPQRFALLQQMAMQKLENVMGFDKEPESISFGVAFEPSSR